jgi:hypothetical protein
MQLKRLHNDRERSDKAERNGKEHTAERIGRQDHDSDKGDSSRLKNPEMNAEDPEQQRVPIRDERAVSIPSIKVESLAFAQRRGDIHLPAAIDRNHAPLTPRDSADRSRDQQQGSLRKPVVVAAGCEPVAAFLCARLRVRGHHLSFSLRNALFCSESAS